jgi:peptidoglycan/LPS O-acetylase OafA/YrhL
VPNYYIIFTIFMFTAGTVAENCKGRRFWAGYLFFQNFLIGGGDDYPCFDVGWYICLQMQLYIITPLFVLAYLKSKTLGHACTLGAILLCLALRYFFYDARDNAHRFLYFRMAPYLVGVLFS